MILPKNTFDEIESGSEFSYSFEDMNTAPQNQRKRKKTFKKLEYMEKDFTNQFKEDNCHDLAYRKHILDKPYSPAVVYLPTTRVMFKLMRACIGAYDASDLWFNQGIEVEEENERMENARIAHE